MNRTSSLPLAALITSVCLSWATSAAAFGGLELSPGGARSLARGGATVARAEDGYVLLHNPAGLADLQSDELMLNVDVAFHDMCVTPYGYYGWGAINDGSATSGKSDFGDSSSPKYANDPLDRVCNSAPVAPLPGLTYTFKLNDDLGIGIGMLAPNGLPGLQYGGEDGTISTPDGARPTPTRYQLVQQKVTFALGPSVGVGYRVAPRVRIGATFTWIAVAQQLTVVQALAVSTSPDNDMFAKLRAHDYFIPAITGSVVISPIDTLDVALAGRVVDNFNGSGDLTYTTNNYEQSGASGFASYKNDPLKLTKVKTGLPWLLTAGVRYASPLPNAPRDRNGVVKRGDPLSQEQFDIELDGGFQMNTRTSESHVSFAPGEIVFRRTDGTPVDPLNVPDPDMNDFSSSRHAKNAGTVRLGGTYNVLPSVLGVSAGVFYETRSLDAAYANIDTFGFARSGFGLGAIARASGWDFAIGFGHVFQETVIVAPPKHQAFQLATEDPTTGFDKRTGIDDPDGTSGTVRQEKNPPKTFDATARLEQAAVYDFKGKHTRVVNAGVYNASFNLLSFNVAYRF